MKAIVLYRSQTGFTRRYGEWISDELACPLKDIKDVKIGDLDGYDTIIFGGPLFADIILGLGYLKKFINEKRKVFIFATGISRDYESKVEEIKRNIPDILKEASLFYLPGGFDYKRLTFINRQMIKLLRRSLKNKEDEEAKRVYRIMTYGVNMTSKEKIYPLISKVRLG